MSKDIEKKSRDMLKVKHDIIEILIKNERENKIEHDEIENFIFFINAMLKKNKSKNSIEGRIAGLQNLINDFYYNRFREIDYNYTKKKNN